MRSNFVFDACVGALESCRSFFDKFMQPVHRKKVKAQPIDWLRRILQTIEKPFNYQAAAGFLRKRRTTTPIPTRPTNAIELGSGTAVTENEIRPMLVAPVRLRSLNT